MREAAILMTVTYGALVESSKNHLLHTLVAGEDRLQNNLSSLFRVMLCCNPIESYLFQSLNLIFVLFD